MLELYHLDASSWIPLCSLDSQRPLTDFLPSDLTFCPSRKADVLRLAQTTSGTEVRY